MMILYYPHTNVLYRRFVLLTHLNERTMQKAKILFLSCLSITLIVSLALITTRSGLANAQQNKTIMQPQEVHGMTTNATNINIVLVHGPWADGSSWSQEIPILQKAGHRVIAVQLPEHL
jgi:pimeloyl-ACP methyl ester carboxylesterase